jgi:arylsulfatase A-like enzyme
MEIRDELLTAWPRNPSKIRRHIADYYGMITHMDHRIGDILQALDNKGLTNDTVVVYTSDHGLSIGQHGLMGKQNMYDHSVRIPFILRGGELPTNRKIDSLLQQYDIFATLCDLVGAEIPAGIDGQSALPLIRGETDSIRHVVGAVYKDVQRMICDGRWKLIRYYRSSLKPIGTDAVQLFDLRDDPEETCNLAALSTYREIRDQLSGKLDEWMKRHADSLAK